MPRPARLPHPFGQALALERPPLCEEIALWLIADGVDLEARCAELGERSAPPYWAFCWGSGQALARWLLDHQGEARGRRVVDLGCGSGVAGIAAALCGASEVVAIDLDPDARAAALENAAANGLGPQGLRTATQMPPDWDLLLAGDLLYEPGLGRLLEALQHEARLRGAAILAGEPERPGNPGHPGEPLARYAVRTHPDVDTPTVGARVHRLA